MKVIEAKNISKKYSLGTLGSGTLKGDILNVFNKGKSNSKNFQENTFTDTEKVYWALKDVSFEINKGDSVGIIGKNGAGKSTLLKILSRITAPTQGTIKVKGRIASLLEVGTGFHPELSGRDNVFLNGAILGMKKLEIKSKFDEIIDFSGISNYIDTPVKRYSSGMYVRLAFAVAAHLDPEILVIDEVLAVGDVEFQKKCINKMKDVTHNQGKTLLFVSHSMGAVSQLCNVGIFLEKGVSRFVGPIAETISHYSNSNNVAPVLKKNISISTSQIVFAKVYTPSDNDIITPDSPLIGEFILETPIFLKNCYVNFVVEDAERNIIIHSRTDNFNGNMDFNPGTHLVKVNLKRIGIKPGIYSASFRIFVGGSINNDIYDSDQILLEVKGNMVSGIASPEVSWQQSLSV